MYFKDRRGACVPYQEKDLRYDITQGYLRKEGAGQVMKEGVLHRGQVDCIPHGTSFPKLTLQGEGAHDEQGAVTRPC